MFQPHYQNSHLVSRFLHRMRPTDPRRVWHEGRRVPTVQVRPQTAPIKKIGGVYIIDGSLD